MPQKYLAEKGEASYEILSQKKQSSQKVAFKGLEHRPKQNKPNHYSQEGKALATRSPLDTQETPLIYRNELKQNDSKKYRRNSKTCMRC